MRVDHGADRLVRNLAHSRQRLGKVRPPLIVDDQYIPVARKDEDVATGPDENGDIAAKMLDVERSGRRGRLDQRKRN